MAQTPDTAEAHTDPLRCVATDLMERNRQDVTVLYFVGPHLMAFGVSEEQHA
jgi:hypothetical protein